MACVTSLKPFPKASLKSNICDLPSETFYDFIDTTLVYKFSVIEHQLQPLIGCLPCKEKKKKKGSAPYSEP